MLRSSLAALTLLAIAPAMANAAPGDLLDATPMTAEVTPGVPMTGGKAWKITYESTSAEGQPVDVTGTVLVPDGAADPKRPLIGYAIGSQGLADRCAPSAQLAAGSEYEAGVVQSLLARGWVLALTDYPGLGTPGDHTYVVGKANGPAVLDAMRAARRLPQAGLAADGPAALFGYSEGGGATGAAVEQQPTYAPDIPLKGAAVGGVVADFKLSREHVEGSSVAFLLMYSAIGFNAAYPELHLDDALNDRGRAYAAQMRGSCLEEAAATGQFTHSTDYTKVDLFDRPDWAARIRQNTLGSVRPQTPVLLTHTRNDEALPFAAAQQLATKWCALGADVEFHELLGQEHIAAGVENASVATDWLADRFAGRPTNGCHAATPATKPRLRITVRRVGRRLLVMLRPTGATLTDVRIRAAKGRRTIARRRVARISQIRRVTLRVRHHGRIRVTAVGHSGAMVVRASARVTS